MTGKVGSLRDGRGGYQGAVLEDAGLDRDGGHGVHGIGDGGSLKLGEEWGRKELILVGMGVR